ncbi:uncharacterized protein METZ01_LOCUS54910 [marine metagenome]|uniref:Uncharacterized protein n=1 Tax=marine metagenome TaxID=408172 RepID=A0A381SDG8_9ZZZZ
MLLYACTQKRLEPTLNLREFTRSILAEKIRAIFIFA